MTILQHRIFCAHSGVQIATMEYTVVAGHIPWMQHWNSLVCYHPVFSFSTGKKLAFARSEWKRLAKLSHDGETTEKEDELLRVSWLAVLHTLGSIQQEAPALPSIAIVHATMQKLFALAYWKYHLDSQRFKFPEFRINQLNHNNRFENITFYLDACFSAKEAYETDVNEKEEAAKIRAAERALNKLKSSWLTPPSRRVLWTWIRAHLPKKYEADAEGWMSTLFLGNDKTILDYDASETELMQEILESEMPVGTGILHAVRERCKYILEKQKEETTAWDIVDTPIPATTLTVAPKRSDFQKEVDFIRAQAIWYLNQRKKEQK